jgi:hypothetical protein
MPTKVPGKQQTNSNARFGFTDLRLVGRRSHRSLDLLHWKSRPSTKTAARCKLSLSGRSKHTNAVRFTAVLSFSLLCLMNHRLIQTVLEQSFGIDPLKSRIDLDASVYLAREAQIARDDVSEDAAAAGINSLSNPTMFAFLDLPVALWKGKLLDSLLGGDGAGVLPSGVTMSVCTNDALPQLLDRHTGQPTSQRNIISSNNVNPRRHEGTVFTDKRRGGGFDSNKFRNNNNYARTYESPAGNRSGGRYAYNSYYDNSNDSGRGDNNNKGSNLKREHSNSNRDWNAQRASDSFPPRSRNTGAGGIRRARA